MYLKRTGRIQHFWLYPPGAQKRIFTAPKRVFQRMSGYNIFGCSRPTHGADTSIWLYPPNARGGYNQMVVSAPVAGLGTPMLAT